MHTWRVSLLVFGFWLAVFAQGTPSPAGVIISSPEPGSALQGIMTLTGTTAIPGFVSVEVTFAYSQGKPAGWFLIGESQKAVTDGTLATWDTTTLTDGIYDLRLVVTLADGSQQTVQVSGVRVRNYTLIETNTPLPTSTTDPKQVRRSPTATPPPEITATAFRLEWTPLPANPAAVKNSDILTSLAGGGLAVAGLFFLGGLYLALKSLYRR